MSKITVITNNQPRPILAWHELSSKEQANHDFLDTETSQGMAEFVRYQGEVYYLNDFQVVHKDEQTELAKWNGFMPDTYFSGIVIRFCPDQPDHMIVGRYYVGD